MSYDNRTLIAEIKNGVDEPIYYSWVVQNPFGYNDPKDPYAITSILRTSQAGYYAKSLDQMLQNPDAEPTEYGDKIYVGRMIRSIGTIAILGSNNSQENILFSDIGKYRSRCKHWDEPDRTEGMELIDATGYRLSSGVIVADDLPRASYLDGHEMCREIGALCEGCDPNSTV
ncbi:hypothetical protein KA043_02830 [Candidatus Saccharibacteria bacterium]|jgi:hypothetical protein|nr:hypothetical protein [Candidatus Saccharibacteria bacterium]